MTQFLVMEFGLKLKLLTPMANNEAVSAEEIAETKDHISSSEEFETLRSQLRKSLTIPGVLVDIEMGEVDVRVEKLG